MTEETEPPWKAALRKSIHAGAVCADGCDSCTESHMDAILAAVLPHMESAFKAGRTKTTARAGRKYVERNLTLTRKLREIREYAEHSDDGGIRTRERVLTILDEGDDPAAAADELKQLRKRINDLEDAAYGDATVRILGPVGQIRHLHASVAAQMSRAETLNRLCREHRERVDEVERRYIFDTAELKKRIAELEKRSARLAALEAAGVDNWEGYSNAFAEDDEDDD